MNISKFLDTNVLQRILTLCCDFQNILNIQNRNVLSISQVLPFEIQDYLFSDLVSNWNIWKINDYIQISDIIRLSLRDLLELFQTHYDIYMKWKR